MLLIKNAHVIDAKTHTDAVLDILIERDRIIRMESCISLDSCKESEPTMIDALGNYVLPGLVDVHVHSETRDLPTKRILKPVQRQQPKEVSPL